jgi:PadR family transcriptional regulator, regulatory protein PadR
VRPQVGVASRALLVREMRRRARESFRPFRPHHAPARTLTSVPFILFYRRYKPTPSQNPMPHKDRVLNNNELIVMFAIQRRSRNAYGVSIRDEIESRTSRKMTFGVLYTILTRLEQEGLLAARDGEATPERGGRAKKYFSITGKGQRAMNMSLADLDRMRPSAAIGVAHG